MFSLTYQNDNLHSAIGILLLKRLFQTAIRASLILACRRTQVEKQAFCLEKVLMDSQVGSALVRA